jgi:hypothetical protein
VWIGRGASERGVSLERVAAFGFYVQPQAQRVEHVTVTLPGGASLTQAIDGRGGARFFGFLGKQLPMVKIFDTDGGSFAFGDFFYVAAPAEPAAHADSSLRTPKVVANAADLITNSFNFTISGGSFPCPPYTDCGTVILSLDDDVDVYDYAEIYNNEQGIQANGAYGATAPIFTSTIIQPTADVLGTKLAMFPAARFGPLIRAEKISEFVANK